MGSDFVAWDTGHLRYPSSDGMSTTTVFKRVEFTSDNFKILEFLLQSCAAGWARARRKRFQLDFDGSLGNPLLRSFSGRELCENRQHHWFEAAFVPRWPEECLWMI